MQWKSVLITLTTTFVVGGAFTIFSYNKIIDYYEKKRVEVLESMIQKDLSQKPLTLDMKDLKKMLSSDLPRNDLIKALWVLNVKYGQCSSDMDTIKQTVMYGSN